MTQPKLAILPRGRTYVLPGGGAPLPSVTNILGVLNKPALPRWAAKSVAEWVAANWRSVGPMLETDPDAAVSVMKGSPWRTSGKAADLGSEVHAVAEALTSAEPLPDVSGAAEPYVDGFLKAVSDLNIEIVETERTVGNREVGYAGTFDAIVRIDDQPLICDYKTGKNAYAEAALQLAAYRFAEVIIRDDVEYPMPSTWGGVVLQLKPGSYKLHRAVCDESAFDVFRALREVWTWQEFFARAALS